MKLITNPQDIELNSFEIITQILGDMKLDPKHENIIKRVIHTTADFDYVENLFFSENVVDTALSYLKNGAYIVTDTQMSKSGINKKALSKLGCSIECFIDNEEVSIIAKEKSITRSSVAVEYALKNINQPIIFVVGNAPTALIKLYDIIKYKKDLPKPSLIIGVPVGFVNVIESKELIMELDIPCIIAKGRKGGSNVAAAICNALMYEIVERD